MIGDWRRDSLGLHPVDCGTHEGYCFRCKSARAAVVAAYHEPSQAARHIHAVRLLGSFLCFFYNDGMVS